MKTRTATERLFEKNKKRVNADLRAYVAECKRECRAAKQQGTPKRGASSGEFHLRGL